MSSHRKHSQPRKKVSSKAVVLFSLVFFDIKHRAQPAVAVEYTNCISAEEEDSSIECPDYDIKPSDDEASVLELWGIQSTPSSPMLPGPLWPRVIASMGQISDI